MKINQDLSEVLHDLVRINNDRIESYQKASNDASDSDVDLKAIFGRMIEESNQYIAELSTELNKLGEEPSATGTTISGKIYRAWMDFKSAFSGNDRLSLLELCEFGEDATQKVYQQALVSDQTLSIAIRQLIARQKESLKISHDTIKRYRDMHKKAGTDDSIQANSLRSSQHDLRSENLFVNVNQ